MTLLDSGPAAAEELRFEAAGPQLLSDEQVRALGVGATVLVEVHQLFGKHLEEIDHDALGHIFDNDHYEATVASTLRAGYMHVTPVAEGDRPTSRIIAPGLTTMRGDRNGKMEHFGSAVTRLWAYDD